MNRFFVSLLASSIVSLSSMSYGQEAGSDPCDHEPGGNARGRDRLCLPKGSSSGIARGDFNGDGIGDLAVGVPFEDIGDVQDAGGVNVIYGSATGLDSEAGPSDQFLGYAQTNGRAGSALASGDFDGDGFSDLAVGAPFDDVVISTSGGRIVPFTYSNVVNGSSTIADGTSNTIIFPEDEQKTIQDAGKVHIFYGSRTGLDPDSWDSLNLSHIPKKTPHSLDEFGASLAWGDFDGDGFGDLAVGIPGHNVQAGAVGIFYGSRDGFRFSTFSSRNQLWTQNSSGIADSEEAGDRFGASLAAGDFGIPTGVSDLAIGVAGEDVNVVTFQGRTQTTITVRDAGAVHVLYGDDASFPAGLTAANSQIWTQNSRQIEGGGEIADGCEENDRFGSALASFGIGGSDLAIGVPGEDVGAISNAGAVHAIYSTSGGRLSFTNNQLWTQDSADVEEVAEAQDAFGSALAGGDFNGDGLQDLAIGAPGETLYDQTTPLSNAGAVHVIHYESVGTGLNATAGPGDQLWTADTTDILDEAAAGERFGSALTAWDFGLGFLADLAIGVPFETVQFAGAGAVHVIYADNTTFTPALTAGGNQFWTQNSLNIEGGSEAGDQFGRTVY